MFRPNSADAKTPLLKRLIGKIQNLESLLGELFSRKIPAIENKLDDLRDLLANRRKEHYLVEEISLLTGRSSHTIRRWIAEKKLSAIRIREGGPRGRLLIPRSELDRLVATGRGAGVPAAVFADDQDRTELNSPMDYSFPNFDSVSNRGQT